MVTVGVVPIRTRLFQEAPYLPARNKIRQKNKQKGLWKTLNIQILALMEKFIVHRAMVVGENRKHMISSAGSTDIEELTNLTDTLMEYLNGYCWCCANSHALVPGSAIFTCTKQNTTKSFANGCCNQRVHQQCSGWEFEPLGDE